jgi:hypothetical protein
MTELPTDKHKKRTKYFAVGIFLFCILIPLSFLIDPVENVNKLNKSKLWNCTVGTIDSVELKFPWYKNLPSDAEASYLHLDIYLTYSYK